uniref:Mitochondrial translational initiation factor 3 n=1 Tax=Hucho hucho TaxID=62062 RepID=A0A4W5P824_9TELE
MSSACLRWSLCHAPRGVCGVTRSSWRIATGSRLLSHNGNGQVPNKKQDPRARAIGSLGRKIQQRHLQVISETGENMVTMHRADVLRLMDENGLKLVPQRKQDPPVYRLMTGKQIHEAQLKLGEKQKAKTAVKELTFSSDIGNHDLLTKLRQVQNWLDKKHHVRITLRTGCMEHAQPLDTTLEQMLQEVLTGFLSKPKVIQYGRAAMFILCPPSAKSVREMNVVTTSGGHGLIS